MMVQDRSLSDYLESDNDFRAMVADEKHVVVTFIKRVFPNEPYVKLIVLVPEVFQFVTFSPFLPGLCARMIKLSKLNLS